MDDPIAQLYFLIQSYLIQNFNVSLGPALHFMSSALDRNLRDISDEFRTRITAKLPQSIRTSSLSVLAVSRKSKNFFIGLSFLSCPKKSNAAAFPQLLFLILLLAILMITSNLSRILAHASPAF
jgi:hypothetical protein